MRDHRSSARGFTLVEIVVALVILAILVGMAVPRFLPLVEQLRVRAALDRVVAEIYRARTVAVGDGLGVELIAESGGDGCVRSMRIIRLANPTGEPPPVVLDTEGICLRHTGGPVLSFNSRGMLRPPARSFYAVGSNARDSLLISIGGRVRRNYRRKGRAEILARGGKNVRFPIKGDRLKHCRFGA